MATYVYCITFREHMQFVLENFSQKQTFFVDAVAFAASLACIDLPKRQYNENVMRVCEKSDGRDDANKFL